MASIVLRPSGVLGDANSATYTTDSGPSPGGAPSLVELSVTAARLVPSADLGAIASVTLSVVASVENSGAYALLGHLTWQQNSDLEATDEDATLSMSGFPETTGTTHAVNPWTGLPWTWSDVNDLRGLGAKLSYTYNPALAGPVRLHVAEVYATVVYADHVTTETLVTAGAVAGSVCGADGVGGSTATGAVTQAREETGVGGPVTVSAVTRARGWEGVA